MADAPHLTPVIKRSNWRVVVEPRSLGDWRWVRTADHLGRTPEQIDREYRERCEEIVADVRRHCDNVDRAYVECDEKQRCPHCGYTWSPDANTGLNGCCHEEMSAWAAQHQDDSELVRREAGPEYVLAPAAPTAIAAATVPITT